MTCICIDDLRPASFRGVPFFVASDKETYGRRIVTHEYPMRDEPYNEDMGEKAQKISVSGYLFGDDWVSKKDAIVAACRARGPAILQLPAEGAKMVVVNSLSVDRNKDACGYFGLSFEFTVANVFGIPSAIVGVAEALIGAVFNEAIAPLTTTFDNTYKSDDVSQYVTDNQTARLVDFASMAIDTVESTPSQDDALASDAVRVALNVYQNAPMYAAPDDGEAVTLASQAEALPTIGRVVAGSGYTQINGSGVTIVNGASAIVPVAAAIINTIGKSLTPDDAVTTFTAMAQWSSQETSLATLQARRVASGDSTPSSNPVSSSDIADATNGTVFCGVVRSLALMKLAQAISAKAFRDRAEAIQARATVVELFNNQIALFEEDAIVNLLLKARDLAVQAVTQTMTTLAPVLTINAPMPRPSLYWAGRLYEDVTRAEELADRNGVTLPAFMPINFEALAR